MRFKTIKELIYTEFKSSDECNALLESIKWTNKVYSPYDRLSKTWKCKTRYKCKNTNKYFNVLTGTIFENTRIDLRKWFIAIRLYSLKNKPTARMLSQIIQVQERTAQRILKLLRLHLPSPHEDFKANLQILVN